MNYTSNNYIHNYILFSLNLLAKNEYQFYFFTVKNQYEKQYEVMFKLKLFISRLNYL